MLILKINLHKKIGRKEGNVLFNDTLNTFYLRLYGIIHIVKDHKKITTNWYYSI